MLTSNQFLSRSFIFIERFKGSPFLTVAVFLKLDIHRLSILYRYSVEDRSLCGICWDVRVALLENVHLEQATYLPTKKRKTVSSRARQSKEATVH